MSNDYLYPGDKFTIVVMVPEGYDAEPVHKEIVLDDFLKNPKAFDVELEDKEGEA